MIRFLPVVPLLLLSATGSGGTLPHRLALTVEGDDGAGRPVLTGRLGHAGPVAIRFCLLEPVRACGGSRTVPAGPGGRFRLVVDPDLPTAGIVRVTASAPGTAPAATTFTYLRAAVLRSFDVRREGGEVVLAVRFTEPGSERTLRGVELLAEGEGQSWGSQNSYGYDPAASPTAPVVIRIRAVRDTTLRVLPGPFHTGSTGAVFVDAKAATGLTALRSGNRLSGVLTYTTATGPRPLGQRSVQIFFRPSGSRAWTRAGTARTGPAGRWSFTLTGRLAPGSWQARFPREDDYLAAISPSARV
ncbi:hypothetical protein [Actinocorallia longicatena]|uniref:Uncharacterized protein n=1 Tax=Actinocorallia longicatena TaxID=111803 RepID=A0ABP6QNH9_9ACTN